MIMVTMMVVVVMVVVCHILFPAPVQKVKYHLIL